MTIQAVPADGANVQVSAAGRLAHRCPFVDEPDDGEATVEWRTTAVTLELHSLAAHLASYKDAALSHEQITRTLLADTAATGVQAVRVVTRWVTAGLAVEVVAEP